jgi:hypothetical protein
VSVKASLRDWNDFSKVQPEIKTHQYGYQHSDVCWVLLKDGSVNQGRFFEVNGRGTFGFKKGLVTHWAYKDVPPPLPKNFKPEKITYTLTGEKYE